MLDWAIVARIWSGYGVNIAVLIILLLVAWILRLATQRAKVKDKEGSKEG